MVYEYSATCVVKKVSRVVFVVMRGSRYLNLEHEVKQMANNSPWLESHGGNIIIDRGK